ILLETAGWPQLDAASKSAFGALLEAIERAGIQLLRRTDSALLEKLESAIADAASVCIAITGWENRWYQRNLVNEYPEGGRQAAKGGPPRARGEGLARLRHPPLPPPGGAGRPRRHRAVGGCRDNAVEPRARPAVARRCAGQAFGTAPDRRSRLQLSKFH